MKNHERIAVLEDQNGLLQIQIKLIHKAMTELVAVVADQQRALESMNGLMRSSTKKRGRDERSASARN